MYINHVTRKPVSMGLQPGMTQTGPLSYRSWVESWNFGYTNYKYYTIKAANDKDSDQTARMRRLICVFVVHIWYKQVLTWRGSLMLAYRKTLEMYFVDRTQTITETSPCAISTFRKWLLYKCFISLSLIVILNISGVLKGQFHTELFPACGQDKVIKWMWRLNEMKTWFFIHKKKILMCSFSSLDWYQFPCIYKQNSLSFQLGIVW